MTDSPPARASLPRFLVASADPHLLSLLAGLVEPAMVEASVELSTMRGAVIDWSHPRAAAMAVACAHQGVPVVLVAADGASGVSESVRGAVSLLLRPIDPRALAAAVHFAAQVHATEQASAGTWSVIALRSITDAVIGADAGGRVTFMNPGAVALTGWTESDAFGHSLDDVFCIDSAAGAGGGRDGTGGGNSVSLKTHDGTRHQVEHSAAPIVDDTGALIGVLVVFRDVTERRQLEKRLAIGDRMSALGTLSAGIAHELNNPLAFVASNVDFSIGSLQDRLARAPDAELTELVQALEDARHGVKRAADIVKDMKTLAGGAEKTSDQVDVDQLVGFAARVASNEIRHRAALTLDLKSAAAVRADPGALTQVVVNLLTNAIQSIDERAIGARVDLATWSDGRSVFIRVTDTGCGIPPEHQPRIFEPFFTTRPVGRGVGLGLAICHAVVSDAGGSITVESEVGKGTSVIVALPQISKPAAHVDDRTKAPRRPCRVLVIDDEVLIGTAVKRILTREGMDVTVESHARRALERLAADATFDVIVCDLMMPEMSGVEFYEELGKSLPAMASRVMFMTGNAFTPSARQFFSGTANVTIDKPFSPRDLTAAVFRVVEANSKAA